MKNDYSWGDVKFEDIFDEAFNYWLDPPSLTISLNLTPDEIEQCKRYAKSRLLQERPEYKIKEQRMRNSDPVRLLIKYYEERQADILKSK